MRIKSQEELDKLVQDILTKVTMNSEEEVNNFLSKRYTKYNKDKKIDSYLKTRNGKIYLPYPYNSKLIAQLHASAVEKEDDYDF